RAGAGFSDAGRLPRTSVRIADELHSALHQAGIRGPYILIGHAFGGDNVRTFAARYTSEAAGLVLVEADVGGPGEHRGDAQRIAARRQSRDAVAQGKPLTPLPTGPGRPPRSCAQQLFRGLPEELLRAGAGRAAGTCGQRGQGLAFGNGVAALAQLGDALRISPMLAWAADVGLDQHQSGSLRRVASRKGAHVVAAESVAYQDVGTADPGLVK